MELEFVQGVRMSKEKAAQVGQVGREEGIVLSCHAPYWINLNSQEPEKIAASRERLMQAARVGAIIGVTGVVFHPAFYHGESSDVVLNKVAEQLAIVKENLDAEGIALDLRPETTGKPTQFGSLEEIVRLSQLVPGVLPCIDISHLHARSNGEINSYDEFCEVLEIVSEALGDRWVKNAHFHISGIDYGPKGEKKHVILQESDFNYQELLRAIHSFGIEGLVICESPNLEEDALILQEYYRSL